jgi:outer membrane protein OmpA-like peptidoglycan-associated protein
MRKFWLLTCILLASLALYPQKRLYLKSMEEGNYLFLEKNYLMALQSYEMAYSIDSTNSNINYKIGLTYLNLASKKKKALRYLEKASRNITKNYDEDDPALKYAPMDAIYQHARALHINSRFEEAKAEFEKYKRIVGDKNKERLEEINRQIEMCNNAITLSANPAKISIKNLGDSINTEFPDYGPVVNADESYMLFTSRRPGSTGGERGIDGSFYEDIYASHRKPDGTWGAAQKLFSLINTSSNEATIGLSPDGQKVYIYKDDNGGDLYYSTLTGEVWSGITSFGEEINSPYWETHITVSADGNSLFFSSDRPGGLGGLDLYRCVRLPNGKWSKPLNLGPRINSKDDEDAPYLHPDGKKLFFSSEGHNSMGGLDIMYAEISTDENGNMVWSDPINVGMPINTPDDDEFYIPSVDGRHAYFSSAREEVGFGDHDIYIADLPKGISVEPLVLLRGLVEFDGEHTHPDKVNIAVFDGESGELVATAVPNYATGKFILILNPGPNGKKYKVNYEATGYQPITHNITVEPGAAYQVIDHEIDFDFINMESKAAGTISLSGTVKNEKGAFIPGVQINVKDNNTGNLIHTYTTASDSGYYYFVVERGKNYNVSFEAPGYLFQSHNIDIPKKPDYLELKKNVVLEKIHEGAKVVLNNIFFDKNKATLRKQSTVELETVYKLLKDNPHMVIEISGHTDNQGDDAANLKLSQNRAQSVVNHLTKKGIPKGQLIGKGYGETQPIAPNTLPNGKPDLAGQQMNRRVEMKIVETEK